MINDNNNNDSVTIIWYAYLPCWIASDRIPLHPDNTRILRTDGCLVIGLGCPRPAKLYQNSSSKCCNATRHRVATGTLCCTSLASPLMQGPPSIDACNTKPCIDHFVAHWGADRFHFLLHSFLHWSSRCQMRGFVGFRYGVSLQWYPDWPDDVLLTAKIILQST